MPSSRLVVIDDNPKIGDFVRNVAEPLGYAVETFTDARGFKAAIGRTEPDVVILDLAMPDIDGIELLKFLAERRTRARIFIMSGFDPEHQRMARTIGEDSGLVMAGIIPKPVRAAELRATLMQAPKDGQENI